MPSYISWLERFGTGTLLAFEPEYLRDIEVILEWWGREYQDTWMRSDIDHFTSSMKKCCYGRSFFTTNNGSMVLANPRAAAGDIIVYFPGGLYPFILRPDGDDEYSLIGDCFLYDFDEFNKWTIEEVNDFKPFVIR